MIWRNPDLTGFSLMMASLSDSDENSDNDEDKDEDKAKVER